MSQKGACRTVDRKTLTKEGLLGGWIKVRMIASFEVRVGGVVTLGE